MTDRRHALAFNAIGPALKAHGAWLSLSTRQALAAAVIAAIDEDTAAGVRDAARQAAGQPAAEQTHAGYDVAGNPSVHRGSRERCYDSACETDQTACRHCKGSGADPDDEGDYIPEVGRHNPYSVGPCPECHGTGKAAVGGQDAGQPTDRAAILRELADDAENNDGLITAQELRRMADEK